MSDLDGMESVGYAAGLAGLPYSSPIITHDEYTMWEVGWRRGVLTRAENAETENARLRKILQRLCDCAYDDPYTGSSDLAGAMDAARAALREEELP